MRMHLLAAGLLLATILLMALSADAARARFSYRSRVRFRIGRTSRYSSRYSYLGPVYTRRLSPSLMGPLYYGYATRYPMYFNYRHVSSSSAGDLCINNLALSNGSYVGTFRCPFLPDEPSSWTKCCGYDGEGFCCDPSYDDSWKLAVGLSAIAIVAIVGGCLLALGLLIGLIVWCCCCSKNHKSSGGSGGASFGPAAAGKESVSNPVKPPYPTMEYGTVQPAATAGPPGSAPYPLPQQPPYPPPYSAAN